MLTEEQKEYIRINFRQGKEKIAELYGAINYIAAAIIVKQEEKQNEKLLYKNK